MTTLAFIFFHLNITHNNCFLAVFYIVFYLLMFFFLVLLEGSLRCLFAVRSFRSVVQLFSVCVSTLFCASHSDCKSTSMNVMQSVTIWLTDIASR